MPVESYNKNKNTAIRYEYSYDVDIKRLWPTQKWFCTLNLKTKKENEVKVYWSDLERFNKFKFVCPQPDKKCGLISGFLRQRNFGRNQNYMNIYNGVACLTHSACCGFLSIMQVLKWVFMFCMF